MTATHTAIAQTDGSETNAEAVQTYVWTGCQNGTFVSPQPDLWRLQPHRMPCVQCQTTQAITHARNSSCRRLGRWQEASGSAVSAQVSSGSSRSRVQFTPTIAPPGAISSVLCDALGGGRAGATRIVVDVDYDNATATAASALRLRVVARLASPLTVRVCYQSRRPRREVHRTYCTAVRECDWCAQHHGADTRRLRL